MNPISPSRVPDKYLSAPMTGSFGGDDHSYLSAFETNTYDLCQLMCLYLPFYERISTYFGIFQRF